MCLKRKPGITELSTYTSRCYEEHQKKPLEHKPHQNFSYIPHRTRKGNAGNITIPIINLCSRATVTETAWYPHRNKWCQGTGYSHIELNQVPISLSAQEPFENGPKILNLRLQNLKLLGGKQAKHLKQAQAAWTLCEEARNITQRIRPRTDKFYCTEIQWKHTRLKRWLSNQDHWMLFWRTQVDSQHK